MTGVKPADLPPRIAAAVHALLEASADGGPVTSAEVCEYDSNAPTVRHTSAALVSARRRGLAVGHSGLWSATAAAWDMRRALEDLVCS